MRSNTDIFSVAILAAVAIALLGVNSGFGLAPINQANAYTIEQTSPWSTVITSDNGQISVVVPQIPQITPPPAPNPPQTITVGLNFGSEGWTPQPTGNLITDWMNWLFKPIIDAWNGFWANVQAAIANAWNQITWGLTQIWHTMVTTVATVINVPGMIVNSAWQNITGIIADALSGMPAGVQVLAAPLSYLSAGSITALLAYVIFRFVWWGVKAIVPFI